MANQDAIDQVDKERALIEYTTHEDYDGIGEGDSEIPKGWKIYLGGTLVWMVYYYITYTPMFTGWTQNQPISVILQQ